MAHEYADLAMIRKIQTIALFVGMGDGHLSEEEMKWLDEEAPGLIDYCLRAKPAIEAFISGRDPKDIEALLPTTVEHRDTVSIGGGPPTWMMEALDLRRASENIAQYEAEFASELVDPIDQIIAHYFSLKMLIFSGQPHEGEMKAYTILLNVFSGNELSGEFLEQMLQTARELLPSLLGLQPVSVGLETD
jgi:hypothetical protein